MHKIIALVLPLLLLTTAAEAQQSVKIVGNSGGVATVTSGALNVNISGGGAGSVTANQGATGTNAQAWWAQIGDTTNGPVAVKAPSTAPVATDKGLVVSLSPNGINANGSATAANSAPVVIASNQSVADPCMFQAKTNLAVSFQTTSITQLIALSGSTKIYVCSVALVASAATVFSITGGTGSNCGTPAAVIGTTSATHGLSLAANGGMTLGNGEGTVASTAAGSELCIVQSGAGDISGNLTYVQQ